MYPMLQRWMFLKRKDNGDYKIRVKRDISKGQRVAKKFNLY